MFESRAQDFCSFPSLLRGELESKYRQYDVRGHTIGVGRKASHWKKSKDKIIARRAINESSNRGICAILTSKVRSRKLSDVMRCSIFRCPMSQMHVIRFTLSIRSSTFPSASPFYTVNPSLLPYVHRRDSLASRSVSFHMIRSMPGSPPVFFISSSSPPLIELTVPTPPYTRAVYRRATLEPAAKTS